MKSALLRFAPVFTSRVHAEPRLARKMLVERGALVPLSLSKPTPVVIDHDPDRQVGTVRSLVVLDEVLSGGLVAPWYVAFVDLTNAPGWLKRGGGVSWCYNNLRTWEPSWSEFSETVVLAKALIHEVSILSPTVKPAEPFARVCWIGEKETSSAAARSTTTSDRASPPARVQEKREPRFQTRSPLDRLYDEHMATKQPQVIVRHFDNAVLGVR